MELRRAGRPMQQIDIQIGAIAPDLAQLHRRLKEFGPFGDHECDRRKLGDLSVAPESNQLEFAWPRDATCSRSIPVNSPCSRKAPRNNSDVCKRPSTSIPLKTNWPNSMRDASQPKHGSSFATATNMKHWRLKAAAGGIRREVDKDKKRVKIAVKVEDIFGNDTKTIVDVAVK